MKQKKNVPSSFLSSGTAFQRPDPWTGRQSLWMPNCVKTTCCSHKKHDIWALCYPFPYPSWAHGMVNKKVQSSLVGVACAAPLVLWCAGGTSAPGKAAQGVHFGTYGPGKAAYSVQVRHLDQNPWAREVPCIRQGWQGSTGSEQRAKIEVGELCRCITTPPSLAKDVHMTEVTARVSLCLCCVTYTAAS